MRPVHALLARLSAQTGQSAAEYVILLVWTSLLVVVAATTLGKDLSQVMSSTANRV